LASIKEINTEVIEVYIATFNRASDATGLAYWVAHIVDDGWSLESVAKSMFDSQEVAQAYPETLSNDAFITEVYNNVLNRDPDEAGHAYWAAQIDNGSMRRDQTLIAIINGAKADTGSAEDKVILQNKADAGYHFAITNELDDLDIAKSTMEMVTHDTDSVIDAKDQQDIFKFTSDSKTVIEGTDSQDILTATEDESYIYGYDGDDIITTAGGDNIVVSGGGLDSIYSQDGNDIIKTRDGNDTVYAGSGDDMIYGDQGDDSLHGEAGDDTIEGSDGDDYIYGDEGNDIITAGADDDYIYGGSGDDYIYANGGDDYINTGSGVDFVDAGDGDDIVHGSDEVDTIYSGSGDDEIYSYDGSDIIDGLIGNDIIYSGAGDDTVNGNDGNDTIDGGSGADRIDAEEGSDTIYGGKGADTLTGGAGTDIFNFTSQESTMITMDYITDFTYSIDHLVLKNQGDEIISSSKTDVSAATTLAEAADIVSSQDGSTNAIVNWFTYEDFTYIAQDLSAEVIFDETTDIILKLQGIINLEGLSSSTISFT